MQIFCPDLVFGRVEWYAATTGLTSSPPSPLGSVSLTGPGGEEGEREKGGGVGVGGVGDV